MVLMRSFSNEFHWCVRDTVVSLQHQRLAIWFESFRHWRIQLRQLPPVSFLHKLLRYVCFLRVFILFSNCNFCVLVAVKTRLVCHTKHADESYRYVCISVLLAVFGKCNFCVLGSCETHCMYPTKHADESYRYISIVVSLLCYIDTVCVSHKMWCTICVCLLLLLIKNVPIAMVFKTTAS